MIETGHLKLVACELAHFEAFLAEPQRLEQMLDVVAAEGWHVFPDAMAGGYKYLQSHPDEIEWGTYLFVHTADKALIGLGGYKGRADEAGMLEIGYALAPAYRSRGLATEAARGMIDYAFSHPHIKIVQAHTLAEPNHSTRVLEKVGMKFTGALHDPEDGDIWQWRLSREDYRKARSYESS